MGISGMCLLIIIGKKARFTCLSLDKFCKSNYRTSKTVWKMENDKESNKFLDDKITKNFDEIELEKEKKLLNLIVEIIVKATLKEYYETCD